MENRRAVLDLKDVPPPPHHVSSSQPSQSFSLTSLSLLPPCLPHAQIKQDSQHRQLMSVPPTQEGASPKVSACDRCRAGGYGLSGAGGGAGSGSSIGRVPVGVPSSPGVHISSSFSKCGACSMTSSVYCKHNLSSRGEGVLDPLLGFTCKPQSLSTVATSQPILSHPHHSCCSGPLYPYPSAPFPGNKTGPCTSLSAPAPPFPCLSCLPAPLRSSYLDSFDYCSCGVDCCPAAGRPDRNTRGDGLGAANTTTAPHFCSNPLHLNVERTGCLKGAHLCQDCMLKVG